MVGECSGTMLAETNGFWLVSSEQTLNFVDHNKLERLNHNIAQEQGTKEPGHVNECRITLVKNLF